MSHGVDRSRAGFLPPRFSFLRLLSCRFYCAVRDASVDLEVPRMLISNEIYNMKLKRKFVIGAIASLLCYAGLVEPNWIKTRSYDLAIPGLAHDLTVVEIGDIHTNQMGLRERRTLDTIRKIDPDFVFVAGDLMKSNSRTGQALDFLSQLTSKRGVYFVPGNADEALTEEIERGTISKDWGSRHILMNENVDCGDFTLVGIDDPVRCRDDARKAFEGVTREKPIFVLVHFHAKRVMSAIEGMGVSFVFAGHTHGGQVGVGPLVSLVPYAHRSPYVAGLYNLDGTRLYVTRGVGTNLFPLRLFCRPEIAVFHFRGA